MNFHINIDELYQGKFDLSPRALEKLKYAIGAMLADSFVLRNPLLRQASKRYQQP